MPPQDGQPIPGVELSIVAPFFNEEQNVDLFFARLLPVLERLGLTFEVICVNDGSTDGTLAKLRHHRQSQPTIKIINFSRNFASGETPCPLISKIIYLYREEAPNTQYQIKK